MKVLRVLGLIFGILLLLTGGGLLAGAAVADKGQSAVEQEMVNQGLKGPVDGVITSEDTSSSTYQVEFTADDGEQYTATAVSTLTTPPQVGDTVSVYYQADDPSVAAIADLPTSALGKVAGTLRVSGIVSLILGAVLLLGGILGFVLGKKTKSALPAQPYGPVGQPAPASQFASYPAQQGGYPQQNARPGQPGAAYPAQQVSPYPPQQPGYPTPPSPYPPQPPSGTDAQR